MFIVIVLIILFLLIFSISFYYFKLLKRFNSIFNDELSKSRKKLFIFLSIVLCLLSINMFSMLGIALIHFIFISLFIDLIYLILKKIIRGIDKYRISRIYKSSVVSLFIMLLVLGYGYFNIRNIVETKYIVYTDKKIGEDIRVLFISDSHFGDVLKEDRLENERIRFDRVDADIVVLGGDIVDESTTKSDMEYIFNVFGEIKNKDGIYYVYGNHDRQQYKAKPAYTNDELESAITSNGIEILYDSYIEINDNVVLAGREDYSHSRGSVSNILKDVDKNDYVMMVDHQPVKYSENIDNGVDLIMSGHTHGGKFFRLSFL